MTISSISLYYNNRRIVVFLNTFLYGVTAVAPRCIVDRTPGETAACYQRVVL